MLRHIRIVVACLCITGLLLSGSCAINPKPFTVHEQAVLDVYSDILEIKSTVTLLELNKVIDTAQNTQLQLALFPITQLNDNLIASVIAWKGGPLPQTIIDLVWEFRTLVYNIDQILPDNNPGKLLLFSDIKSAVQSLTILVMILTNGAGLNA